MSIGRGEISYASRHGNWKIEENIKEKIKLSKAEILRQNRNNVQLLLSDHNSQYKVTILNALLMIISYQWRIHGGTITLPLSSNDV